MMVAESKTPLEIAKAAIDEVDSRPVAGAVLTELIELRDYVDGKIENIASILADQ
jgi:hypothetical protein